MRLEFLGKLCCGSLATLIADLLKWQVYNQCLRYTSTAESNEFYMHSNKLIYFVGHTKNYTCSLSLNLSVVNIRVTL
jgi:hypothetical protein